MRKGLLGSMAALAASAGLAMAQTPARTSGTVASASAGPGRAAVQQVQGTAEPLPMGPSSLAGPQADSPFLAAMQPQFPLDDEPRLNSERAYGELDYILAYARTMPLSYPLVTAGTTGPRGAFVPGTSVVYGGQDINLSPASGGRFTVGLWSRDNPRLGTEFVGMVLEKKTETFTAGYGTQMVARPVINADTGVPTSLTIAAPGYAAGGVTVTANSQLWGFEWNAKLRLWADETKELCGIYGFRYMDLAERLHIFQRSLFVPGVTTTFYGITFANPFEIDVADSFQTRNQYYMSQFGLQGKWRYGRWLANWNAKIGIGGVHETEVIGGQSTLFPTAVSLPNTVPGGLLALSSNIGRYHRDIFAVNPEGGFQIGYRFFRATDLLVGYQFSYLNRALRPGLQIDPQVGSTLVPTSAFYGFPGGAQRPAVLLRQSDYWALSLSAGVHIHY